MRSSSCVQVTVPPTPGFRSSNSAATRGLLKWLANDSERARVPRAEGHIPVAAHVEARIAAAVELHLHASSGRDQDIAVVGQSERRAAGGIGRERCHRWRARHRVEAGRSIRSEEPALIVGVVRSAGVEQFREVIRRRSHVERIARSRVPGTVGRGEHDIAGHRVHRHIPRPNPVDKSAGAGGRDGHRAARSAGRQTGRARVASERGIARVLSGDGDAEGRASVLRRWYRREGVVVRVFVQHACGTAPAGETVTRLP